MPGLFLCHPVLQPRFGEAASGQPHFESGTVVTSEPQHVVYTRDSAGNEAIYLDGLAAATGNRCGTVDNWDTDHQLSLANEERDDREWLGALYLVAVYPSAGPATTTCPMAPSLRSVAPTRPPPGPCQSPPLR